jgi:hypothetical protein
MNSYEQIGLNENRYEAFGHVFAIIEGKHFKCGPSPITFPPNYWAKVSETRPMVASEVHFWKKLIFLVVASATAKIFGQTSSLATEICKIRRSRAT